MHRPYFQLKFATQQILRISKCFLTQRPLQLMCSSINIDQSANIPSEAVSSLLVTQKNQLLKSPYSNELQKNLEVTAMLVVIVFNLIIFSIKWALLSRQKILSNEVDIFIRSTQNEAVLKENLRSHSRTFSHSTSAQDCFEFFVFVEYEYRTT